MTSKFPYEPLRPEKVTVPDAAAKTGVPVDVAISNPVCAELLILLLAPNLEDIIPDTGLAKDIPKLTFPPAIVVAVFTLPTLVVLVFVHTN